MGPGGFMVFVSFLCREHTKAQSAVFFSLKRPRDGTTDLNLIRQDGGARERTRDHWVRGE